MSSRDFQIISRLGEGSYSSVWKVKRISDGQEYAMKKVKLASLSEKEKENALNEVRILASIDDPNIIGYKESFFEDNSLTLCIVMEYAGGGDVYNKIVAHQKKNTYFPEEEIWKIFIDMVKGLKTLHDMKILHRDLKCANVFLGMDGKTAKLGDLNVSKVAKGNLAYTQTGTPYYASPEVWKDQPYDMKSDIWSLGCVLYEVTALKPPFRANDMEGLYKKVQRGIFDRIPSQYSVDLYNIICQCLQVSPAMRPTCDQLLNHPLVLKRTGGDGGNVRGLKPAESNELLKTIKMPKNMKALNPALPKANYNHQSLELEKGRMPKVEEYDRRNISSGNGKRAVSQQAPIANNVQIRNSQSRESKISQYNKIQQAKETELEYLARMQREYIDKSKPVKNPLQEQVSPKGVPAVSKLVKQPSYGSKNDLYRDPRSKQEELINKYQNRAYEVMDKQPLNKEQQYQQYQRQLSEKEGLNKKADYLIQKYQPSQQQPLQPLASNQTKPPTPSAGYRNGVNNINNAAAAGGRGDAKDLIGRYNNIYSLKDKYEVAPEYGARRDIASPYNKNREYNYPGGASKPVIYQNNYNHLRPQPLQSKVTRPIWWG